MWKCAGVRLPSKTPKLGVILGVLEIAVQEIICYVADRIPQMETSSEDFCT
jgi:hypothetical protein